VPNLREHDRFQSVKMAEKTKFGRRDSLVKQASLDRIQIEGIKRRNTIKHRKQLEKSILCKQVR
jgi:hypothetical protein